jgi:hypothetical protein
VSEPALTRDQRVRLARAARSYLFNARHRPVVERRLAVARARLVAGLGMVGRSELRVGPFRIAKQPDGISVERVASDDGWEQLVLDQVQDREEA